MFPPENFRNLGAARDLAVPSIRTVSKQVQRPYRRGSAAGDGWAWRLRGPFGNHTMIVDPTGHQAHDRDPGGGATICASADDDHV